ncbi:hypothetical protein BDR26DRAFT_652180 [Obelidium mucronatum]|nr:hypothetical protein BDR26DRAFT_652180 [Obelidium mucronatum]
MTCNQGFCQCPYSTAQCNGKCMDLTFDNENCGGCGKKCPIGTTCSKSACKCKDASLKFCNEKCMDLSEDTGNCGLCGRKCSPGKTCEDGKCVCSPVFDDSIMEYDVAGQKCVDLKYDERNCGMVGNDCGKDPKGRLVPCKDGVCGLLAPFYKCGSGVSDTSSDVKNCGQCGFVCGDSKAICKKGVCTRPTTRTDCKKKLFCAGLENECVDALNDSSNCGACGNQCKENQVCQNGVCAPCLLGEINCNGRCINSATDPSNCGSCNYNCLYTAFTACNNGKCSCYKGLTQCPGSWYCSDLQNDSQNCGQCGNTCRNGYCSKGQCKCYDYGYGGARCVAQNGTEYCSWSLMYDTQHCGSCFHACDQNSYCSGGVCIAFQTWIPTTATKTLSYYTTDGELATTTTTYVSPFEPKSSPYTSYWQTGGPETTTTTTNNFQDVSTTTDSTTDDAQSTETAKTESQTTEPVATTETTTIAETTTAEPPTETTEAQTLQTTETAATESSPTERTESQTLEATETTTDDTTTADATTTEITTADATTTEITTADATTTEITTTTDTTTTDTTTIEVTETTEPPTWTF